MKRPGQPKTQRLFARGSAFLAAALIAGVLTAGCATPRTGGSDALLKITSDPDGAVVVIDGQERGLTPLTVRGLDSGRHRVELHLAGHQVLETDEVATAFGETSTFHAALRQSGVAASRPMSVDLAPVAGAGRAARSGRSGRTSAGPAKPDVRPRTRLPAPEPPAETPRADIQTAVDRALKWLADHQSADGSWSADGFDQQCKLNRCVGAGESNYTPGVTGLALLAFTANGHTHQGGDYADTVKMAARYLKNIQDAEGCFGTRVSAHFQYNHLLAAQGMAELYGLTKSPLFKESAQSAVNFTLQSQNPYLGWRYGVRDGDNDTSVTSHAVRLLAVANSAGLDVDANGYKGAVAWVEKMTEPEFGRTGYQRRGGPPPRTTDMLDRFPPDQVETTTACGLTIRLHAGQLEKDSELISKGAELLLAKPPIWSVERGTIDFLYWNRGTLAMRMIGGERARRWNSFVATALVENQHDDKARDELGSWDITDPWGSEGGRVYTTALNCQTLGLLLR